MISIAKGHWPLIAAIGMLWVMVAICLVLSISQNQGHLIYALDDPYIHMAVAKNLAQHGVWGVTKNGFASSSSSLLWVLLLSSIYFLFGINEVSPFILNVIFGTFICILVYILLRKYKLQAFFTFVVLSLIIFFTPLIPLIFCGMEHTLHALITILFVYLSAKTLSEEKPASLESSLLLILAPLLIMTRYEGLFLVFVVSCLFIIKRKPLYALLLGGLGILPMVIYGLVSISKGWYFLPNSVLLKGNMPDFSSLRSIINLFDYSGYKQIARTPHILMLILGASIVFHFQYSKQKEIWKGSVVMIIILIATTFLHMQFARTGWFYRYEAYLVALGIFIMGISLGEYLPEKLIKLDKKSIPQYIALAFFILFLVEPFLTRGASLERTPQATTNTYEQQYQMGLFLREFYQGRAVAANDIGAINYLADINCVDLLGFGNLEVGKARSEKHYNSHQVYEVTKSENVSIAIIYDHWFRGIIPSQWIKVGQWKILNNVVCGGDTVSFYAVDPSEVDNLIEHLEAFSAYLPKNVVQSGEYT